MFNDRDLLFLTGSNPFHGDEFETKLDSCLLGKPIKFLDKSAIKTAADIMVQTPGTTFVSFMDGTNGHSGKPINYVKNPR